MIVQHEEMMPGHLLEYRCPKFGIVFQWRVLGIYLGAERQESLIEIAPVMQAPGGDGRRYVEATLVPEPMTRCLTVIAPGVSPTT